MPASRHSPLPNSIEATLTRLRNEFVVLLPARIDMLEQLLVRVARGEDGAGEALEHAAHSLVGAAGVHRLMDVSAAARKLETAASGLPAKGRADEPMLFALHKALARLAAAAENPAPGFVPPPEARLPLQIALVSNDADRTLWLRSVLENAGFRVAAVSRPAHCVESCCKGDVPAAVIVDVDSLGGDFATVQPVSDLKAQRFPNVPLVFLSTQRAVESRLAAHRAGATHYLTLPVRRETLLQSLCGLESPASRRPYRVLLVDDDAGQLAAQSRILRDAGMDVRETVNPLEAPDLLDGFPADVLLFDMEMPTCSGPELAAIVRGGGCHERVPVVYLADAPDAGAQHLALEQGGEYVLAKPVDTHHLTAVAARCAKRYRQTQEQVETLRATLYERERQQHALDAHAIVSITDTAGNILYANDKFCEASGHSRHELIGKNHRLVKSGIHPPEVYADLWRTITRGLIWHGELCNRHKDGSLYWVETSIVPFLDDQGRPYQYISVRTDITRVKEAEQRLARSQAYANIGTWDWNIETGDLYWSERIAPLFGHPEGALETTYENFLAAVHPDDRQQVAEAARACVEHGAEYDIEHRVVWPDGSVHWLLERGDVVRGAAGTPLRMLGVVQDVTERKLAKMALEEAQHLARLGNWALDLATGKCTWSKEVYSLFGRVPDQYVPTLDSYFDELIHPDDVKRVRQVYHRALEHGRPESIDHRVVLPDGTVRWMHVDGCIENSTDGNPARLTGTFQEITERKRTEMALQESRARLEEAQHLARLGDWTLDLGTEEITWSAETYALCNRSPETYTPTRDSLYGEIVHPEDRAALERLRQLIVETRKRHSLDLRICWPDGAVRWMHIGARAEYDENGQAVRMAGTVQDITKRKQIEIALQESRRQLEEAHSLARLGHWTADMKTGALEWSDEIYRIFGHDPAQFTPSVKAFDEAVHPDDRALIDASERRAAETGVHDVVHRIVRPDGEVRYVHELAHARRDADGSIMQLTGTVQDVTELKQAELAMLQAKEAAEAASRAKSEFLASMSHELRTPLNSILGFAQLFGMDPTLPPLSKEHAREIERAGQHLLSLVNDLIDLARIEAGKLELFPAPVSVKSVVADSLAMVAPIARDRGIQLIDLGGNGKDSVVMADSTRLQQVLINLLANAIKYNRPAGAVHLACDYENDMTRIAITDTGPGIPADKQSRMFSPFDRLGAERGQVEGSGIGLVITRRIVEAMGGTIGFESVEGQGSTFWVSLPTTRAIAPAPDAPPGPEMAAPGDSRAHVLYIEDNPMNLRLMQQIFAARKNLELRTAHTAEIGIQLARVDSPALILLDINLPGMDGYAALKALREDPGTAGVPVVAVTANAMKGDEKRGLKAGFDAYLSKPIDIPALFKVVDRLVVEAHA